jgi:endonuclease/exonuclease/phosphatase family metal-dependent hydrolase
MSPKPRIFAAALALVLTIAWSARATEPFVVVSYNLENWLTTDRYVNNKHVSSKPKPETEKAAAVGVIAAHKPAVLGVIEMGSRDDLKDLQSRLKAAGLDYPHAEWHEGLDTDRHVALLSRFPIVERHSCSVPFEINGRPEGIQRGILDVTVAPAPGERLRLIGLHLKSQRKVEEFDQEALRAKEAWFVRHYIDAILAKDPQTPLLLFGDLNTTPDTYPFKELLGAYGAPGRLTPIPLADSRGERWTHFFARADIYSRLDYFLASPALSRTIDRAASGIDDSRAWNQASDHRAIFLTVRSTK